MNDIYENIVNYNTNRKRKIVFDDMIADIEKISQSIIKELLNRCRKLNISLVYQSILFFCSKRCKIKFYALFDYEN